jgi:hypothetical protein
MTQLSTLIQGSGKNAIDKRSYIATSGQTAFTVTYSPPYVDVYQNGVRLNVVDYTATSGTSVTLAVGAAVNDEIEVIGFASDASITASFSGSTAPAVPIEGMMWYDTTDGSLYVRTGNFWVEASQAGASIGATGANGANGANGVNGATGATGAVGPAPTLVIVSATTQTAVAGNHYVITNVAATTITMPATATAGDLMYITSGNSLSTNVIAYSGTYKIMGLLENMTINTTTYTTMQLRYLNATIGWALI